MAKQASCLSLLPALTLMAMVVPAAGAVAGEIRGSVVDDAGKPIRGAIVRAALGDRAITRYSGQDGSVVIAGLEPGSYEITVRAFGYGHERQFVDPTKQSTVKLVVTPKWDASTLTSAEYITGLPENSETKLLRAACLGCHSFWPLQQTAGMKADGWMKLLASMGTTVDLTLSSLPLRYRQYLSHTLEKYFGPDAPDPQRDQVKYVPLADEVLKATVYEFDLPNYTKFTHSMTADNKGNGWFTGYSWEANYIASLNFDTAQMTFYPLAIHDAAPHTPVLDKQGRIWTPLADGNAFNMIDPATGENKDFVLPLEQWGFPTDGRAFRLHTASLDRPRNKFWFSSMRSNLLVSFDLNTMEWVDKPPLVYVPDAVPPNTQRTWMAVPPDWHPPGEQPKTAAGAGNDMASTLYGQAQGGRAAARAGAAGATAIGAASYDAQVDSKGKVWYTQLSIGTLSRYDPKTGKTENFTEPGVVSTRGMTIDRDDNIWYSNWDGGQLVKLDQKKGNKITKYDIPTKFATPYGVVKDNKGGIWFADYAGDNLTRFDPKTEKFVEFPIPTNGAMPRFISVDDLGRVWFTEWWQSRVGVLVPDGSPHPLFAKEGSGVKRLPHIYKDAPAAKEAPAAKQAPATKEAPATNQPVDMPSAAVRPERGQSARVALAHTR